MQVLFKRWCMDEGHHGEAITINPKDVVSTEFFHPAYPENMRWPGDPGRPEATRVTLRKGKEFFVQGTVAEVMQALNRMETAE